jgi:hypothetical protein
VQGADEAAIAECEFGGEGSGITLELSEPFSTSLANPGEFASLAGMTTAEVTEPSTAYVSCEAVEEGSSFVIPPESGHLMVTKVGAIHRPQ